MKTMGTSPRWSSTTKLVVMLALLATGGFFLIRFQVLIAPVIMAVILAYLLNPVVTALTRYLRLSRTVAVILVYGILILLVLGLISGAGLLIQNQLSGVLNTALTFINTVPDWLATLSAEPIQLGPFTIDLSSADVSLLQDALLPTARDGISQITQWMTGAASGVAIFLGWTAFVFIVSFYLLHDIATLEHAVLRAVPETYRRDAERLGQELGPIWNAFLRGQLMLSLIMGTAFGVVMSLLGVRYALALALMAALLEFLPVIGPYVYSGTAILIALFQPSNWLGLDPVAFMIVVAAAAWLLQVVESNFLNPRVMGSQLKVHPAILITGALIGVSIMGLPGLLLFGPIIATAGHFGKYIHAKLFNLPPWPDLEEQRSLNLNPPCVLIRPAAETDRSDMLKLTSRMWEGHDYVPRVWSAWQADPEGFLAAAEIEGTMVGFGKLTRLGPREWWMEGLRVHPAYQGLKIGSQLVEHLLDQWKQRGGGVIRLATSSERIQVHHLCDRLGWRRVAVCRVMTAATQDRGACDYQPLPETDTEEALALWRTRNIRGTPDLVNDGWRWSALSEEKLAGFIRCRRAWWWRERSGLLLAYDSEHDNQPSFEVAAIVAPPKKLAPMLRQMRVLADRQKAQRAAWVMSDTPRLADAARRAGFAAAWDARLWIFERSDAPDHTDPKNTEA
jgi:predicted PurR-regulated permease PerM/GNAT superfamily N-acetyltransferase